jgi:hypothetical protein
MSRKKKSGFWNYRVIRSSPVPGKPESYFFGIYEVYYNRDGTVLAYTEDPIAPHSETDEPGIKEDIALMMKAFKKPTLVMGEITPGEAAKSEKK